MLQYISKYISKAKPWLAIFSDILNQILSKSWLEDSLLILIQKLLLYNITE